MGYVRFSTIKIIAAAVATASCAGTVSSPLSADTEVSAPFAWQHAVWCPTYSEDSGCNNIQHNNKARVAFSPSQVVSTKTLNYILLKINSGATVSGAINTYSHEIWQTPTTLSEEINLACNSSGQVENWPAFWLDTTKSWPAGGEIDVMEGLGGVVAWHYHYLSRSGAISSIGEAVPGFSGCGTHTYTVRWTSEAITFYYDGKQVGRVVQSEIGVPIASGPMYVINSYGASAIYGGPTTGGANMGILSFTATGA